MNKFFYIITVGFLIFTGGTQPGFASSYSSHAEYNSPGDIAEAEGAKMSDDLRRNASDRERWKSFTLNNNDTDPKALKLVLIKDAGFTMRLDPKEDHLYFEKIGMRQVFGIRGPSDKIRECKNYNIRVIDASTTHVAIQRNCYSHDVAPGIIKLSSGYYLYDVKTTTMIDFWSTGTDVKKVPLAFVRPDPKITKLHDGYRIDWKFTDTTSNPMDRVDMHNVYHYMIDQVSKKMYLNCEDLTNTQHLEGDLCEKGGDLEAIVK